MCHLILLLPVIALPVFWLLPISASIPIYATVFVISAWIYWYVVRVMRRPVVTGAEELQHGVGKVASIDDDGVIRIRVDGELWRAKAAAPLKVGDKLRVVRLEGLVLHVEPFSEPAEQAARAVDEAVGQ
ncbi:MAG: NfeD family protein [Woeseia sp.]